MAEDPGHDLVESERDVLLYYLNKMRDGLVRTTFGLSEKQLRSPGVPSGTSLLGIVHHLTGVESHWFERVFLGRDRGIDKSLIPPTGVSAEEIVARYREACERSDGIVRSHPDLATMARIVNPGEGEKDSLRSIIVHMIEETARHAGQADILRERIDGTTEL